MSTASIARTPVPDPGTASASVPALVLRGLTQRFGNVTAVDGLDLTVQPGEVVAFLGPNGAGKTSTLDMVLGLTRPTAGMVQVCGTTPRDAVDRGWISAVMQTGGLLKDLTVAETVELTASLFASHQPLDAVMERAGIAGIAERRVGKCSGGEQQRLRFAMALLSDPRLLVLDEPTTGMDVEGRRAFWGAIQADAQKGRTVIFATHYLEEADAYADRVVLVSRGRVVADGTAAQVRAMSSGRTVRATWPGATPAEVDRLGLLDGVESVSLTGSTVTAHTTDSDALARHLLTATPCRDLEVTARGLEDTFLALTQPTTFPQEQR
ncbi:ABC-2 type transport system ATP-binding protein [Quadrisphaera granulorum]|uniref:ABC-2 type transport system ATP-binding protein n=1 Tax=Quadrisphaera granulorum TaxID=317664 RepID=A0A316A8T9_9ACTN|nr:ABC transporter ATP-binding protein [Quadrisphaera granulorum]PWJ54053.1 ABC-2 type transport system ATP-binding protein [Quadrisphaera granulorum]SZE96510.1 ABC-2 type transport system ATP-binding protein [Quadrisphaera granulorum]